MSVRKTGKMQRLGTFRHLHGDLLKIIPQGMSTIFENLALLLE
jgi:hypothetical protein